MYHARLALIDASPKNSDQYYIIQALVDTAPVSNKKKKGGKNKKQQKTDDDDTDYYFIYAVGVGRVRSDRQKLDGPYKEENKCEEEF